MEWCNGRKRFVRLALVFGLAVSLVGPPPVLAAKKARAAVILTRDPKPATLVTRIANAKSVPDSMWADVQDFEDAKRGTVHQQSGLNIPGVWDMRPYEGFIKTDPEAPAPETINPSLYRNAKLNMIYGLFKVTNPEAPAGAHEIYQVRGYDLSNITFVKGDTGWIVFDPLISKETAAAALAYINEKLGARPVKGVVYSHSHVDHYGGVRGLHPSGSLAGVPIYAPEGFTEHAVSENVIAGNAMSRRAIYMYGSLLPKTPQGGVNGGLGQTNSTGEGTLIVPTILITPANLKPHTVDGIEMEFQLTPGTEAPAEMNTYFPQFQAMWMAENTTNTMHNVLTLRGAQVRDPLKWASFLNQTIVEYGPKTVVKFQSHHWPVWNDRVPNRIVDYWKKQRDMYKFIHDQSVNLMNKGYTGSEISERIQFPPSIDEFWPDRGYYGTLRHNSRAVYQRYMGWYDGNPSNLNNLPPEEAARRYITYMGGKEAVFERALIDFHDTKASVETYRWLAEVLKHLVFAHPEFENGKLLLADVLEQLGYQSESGPWRNEYLVGASELRYQGPVPDGGFNTAGVDTIKAMPPELSFDFLAVRLSAELARNEVLPVNLHLTAIGIDGRPDEQTFGLMVENSVLNYGTEISGASKVKMTKATFDGITGGTVKLEDAIASGDIVAETGDLSSFRKFWGMIETYPFWWNIVMP